jgi:hypothetical protein
VVSGGVPATVVSSTSPNAQHQVEVVNRSSLPYDVIVSGNIASGLLVYAAGSGAWPANPPLAIAGLGIVAPDEPLGASGTTGSETLCCDNFVSRLAGAPGWAPAVNPADCVVVTVT